MPCGRSTVTTACHHRHATRKSCVCPDRRQSWGSRAPPEDGPSYGSTTIQGPLPRIDPFRIPQRKQSSATTRGANQSTRGRAHWRSGTSRCGLGPEGSSQEKGLRERRAALVAPVRRPATSAGPSVIQQRASSIDRLQGVQRLRGSGRGDSQTMSSAVTPAHLSVRAANSRSSLIACLSSSFRSGMAVTPVCHSDVKSVTCRRRELRRRLPSS